MRTPKPDVRARLRNQLFASNAVRLPRYPARGLTCLFQLWHSPLLYRMVWAGLHRLAPDRRGSLAANAGPAGWSTDGLARGSAISSVIRFPASVI